MVHRKKRGYSIAVRWWSSAAVIDLSASPRVFFSIFHPGGKNMKDEFEELIDTALVLNGDYSIYEVMDLDRPGRHRTDGGDVYGPPDLKRIERYVAILDRIGEWREPAPSWLTETWKGSVLQRSPFLAVLRHLAMWHLGDSGRHPGKKCSACWVSRPEEKNRASCRSSTFDGNHTL